MERDFESVDRENVNRLEYQAALQRFRVSYQPRIMYNNITEWPRRILAECAHSSPQGKEFPFEDNCTVS